MKKIHLAWRCAKLVSILGLTLWLGACTPALEWREMALDKSSGLVASFPCKPERHERTLVQAGWADPLKVTLWSCSAAGLTWAVSQIRLPQPAQVSELLTAWPQWTRSNLEAAARQLPVARRVDVQDEGGVQVAGMTPWPQARAWRMRTERPDASGRPLSVEVQAWHFAHGLSVFQATVWRTGGASTTQDGEDVAKAFLQGLQFRP